MDGNLNFLHVVLHMTKGLDSISVVLAPCNAWPWRATQNINCTALSGPAVETKNAALITVLGPCRAYLK